MNSNSAARSIVILVDIFDGVQIDRNGAKRGTAGGDLYIQSIANRVVLDTPSLLLLLRTL